MFKHLAIGLCFAALITFGGVAYIKASPADTEVWEPAPPVVSPGKEDADPPSDAVVLFDGRGVSAWIGADDRAPARWPVKNGALLVDKKAGDIETVRAFSSYQLHLEWLVPKGITGAGQYRGNSGVFLGADGPGGYELQILDSYRNPTYVNGAAGSLYKQAAPLVSVARPPGLWQSFDVVWTAPRFGPAGEVVRPARATVFENGVVVQNDVVLAGETVHIGRPVYRAHGPLPIRLQAHPDPSAPIGFRNIWVRPLPDPPRTL